MRISRDQRGQIGHGEVRIGDSVLMIGQASEQWPSSPAAIYVYVPDVDAAYQRALAADAESMWQPVNQPYGDRNGGVKDSNGVQWWMATHLEEVSEEEEARRRAAKDSAPAPASQPYQS